MSQTRSRKTMTARVTNCVLAILLFGCCVSAQTKIPPLRLSPSDLRSFAHFGSSIAIQADTLAIGAPAQADGKSGKVYVYHFDGASWLQEAELAASDASSEDQFGAALALQGDTLAVGAFEASPGLTFAGATYVFHRVNGVWTQAAELTASDGQEFASFGISVAISGKTVAVGALPGAEFETPAGVVYVFVNDGKTWSQQAEITNSDPSVLLFGVGLALHKDTLAIGAPVSTAVQGQFPGAAFVYTRQRGTWTEAATLVPSESSDMAQFGESMTTDGTTIVVGAPGLNSTGAAFVFTGSGGTWTQNAELLPADSNSAFGAVVALHGNELVVGAPSQNFQRGAAYLFTQTGSTWSQTQELHSPKPKQFSLFGAAVGLNSKFVFCGEPLANPRGNLAAGVAWVMGIK